MFEVDDSFKGKGVACSQCNAISQPAPAVGARRDASARKIPAAVAVTRANNANNANNAKDGASQALPAGRERAFGRETPIKQAAIAVSAVEAEDPAESAEADPEADRATIPEARPIDDISAAHTMPAAFSIPKAMGPYDVQEQIGRGGMGIVLQARDKMLNRDVAIKILHPRMGGHASSRKRFLREAQITGQLEHPGVVPVHFMGVDEKGNSFFSMKLVSGRTFHKVLEAWHKHDPHARWEFPLARLLSIFERVCETVVFAHARNVIHCDLKPSNIMIGEYGEVWLLDWGVAKIMGSRPALQRREMLGMKPAPVHSDIEGKLTREGMAGGTPCYMAPEQVHGAPLDDGTDIFALGGVLYEILTGRPPYDGKNVNEILMKAAEGQIEPLAKTGAGRHAPRELAAIAQKCLAANRAARYATVAELLRDLRAYGAGEPVSAYRESIFRRAGRFAWGHARAVSIVLGLALLILSSATATTVFVAHKERQRAKATVERQQAEIARLTERVGTLDKREANPIEIEGENEK